MLFSKAIKLKSLVNQINRDRKCTCFPTIRFNCLSFADGHWAVDLYIPDGGCFFSHEMVDINDFVTDSCVSYWVGSVPNSPCLHFQ